MNTLPIFIRMTELDIDRDSGFQIRVPPGTTEAPMLYGLQVVHDPAVALGQAWICKPNGEVVEEIDL